MVTLSQMAQDANFSLSLSAFFPTAFANLNGNNSKDTVWDRISVKKIVRNIEEEIGHFYYVTERSDLISIVSFGNMTTWCLYIVFHPISFFSWSALQKEKRIHSSTNFKMINIDTDRFILF